LLVQDRIVENFRGNTSTMDGRVRVERANKDLDLGIDTFLFFC
jgi:hypothetical protein